MIARAVTKQIRFLKNLTLNTRVATLCDAPSGEHNYNFFQYDVKSSVF